MNQTVSVIIPVYNVEQYLRTCLDSVINQTYNNLQIILINDGSTDSSGKICDEYAVLDKRVSVIHKQNAGVSAARNDALKVMNGKYVYFIDSDDYIDSQMIEHMLDSMLENNSDIVTVNYRTFDDNQTNENVMELTDAVKNFNGLDFLDIFDALEKYVSVFLWNNLYKAEIIEKNNLSFLPISEVFSEDQLFNLCYYSAVNKSVCINCSYYNYRMRPGSISRTRKKGLVDRRIKLVRELEKFITSNNLKKRKRAEYSYLTWSYFVNGCGGVKTKDDLREEIADISHDNLKYLRRSILDIIFGKAGRHYMKVYSMNAKARLFIRIIAAEMFFGKYERAINSYLHA